MKAVFIERDETYEIGSPWIGHPCTLTSPVLNEFYNLQTYQVRVILSLWSSRPFQRFFYNLKLIKFGIIKKFKSFTFCNKQQNIIILRYDWKLVARNCLEYGMCPVNGEPTLFSREKYQLY